MYKAYIEPDLKTAHLRIYNTFNPFSGFMAPTYILKSAKPVALEAIPAVLKVRACAGLSATVFVSFELPQPLFLWEHVAGRLPPCEVHLLSWTCTPIALTCMP